MTLGILLISILYTMSTSKITRERCYSRADITWMCTGEVRTNGKNNISSGRILLLPKSKRLPNDPLQAISLHCAANLSMNTYAQPGGPCFIRPADQGETSTVQTPAATVNLIKLPPLTQQGAFQKSASDQGYAESLLRPFALRALMTALPPRVLILSRNPWVRLRFILLG